MANAKKCDRCGAYYQETETNAIESLVSAFKGLSKQQILQDNIEAFLDLCPICSKSLKRWVKMDGDGE